MRIKPTHNNLQEWIEIYVPEKDLFFLPEDGLSEIDLSGVIIMPTDEFFNHSTYKQINYVNSYLYWNIKNAHYVIIAEKNWIERISAEERKLIFSYQINSKRGLVVPITFVDEIDKIPSDYIINQNIIIQSAMWEKLERSVKEQLLSKMVFEWWDDGDCKPLPNSMYSFLNPYANTFSNKQGANCLAAVLFAISGGKQEWFIHEWIYQKSFIETLKQYKYYEFTGDCIKKDDVVVWQDKNQVIQHAAYYIGDGLFFNKDGQTIFNPWKIIKEEHLYKYWEHLTPIIYRIK
ncbi:hypothetical protein [Aliicoccus persicus]|uniref:NlpC/P60 family protein n=2 Tax=Aliicoccus persicus TaxID=930138 RepID=A0A662Z026_9STAP|nr:hypothetical protein [Aliicoccus persicus]SEV80119.1 hypothetical protein SAMN05192557_0058 [Aliicoccus persicus]